MPIANNSSPTPNSRTLEWASEVRRAWGPEFYQPDVAYQWSNGREFKSTDSQRGGIYAGTST